MKRLQKLKAFILSSRTNTVAFVLAACLVLSASIGGAKAAISYFTSRVTMYDIGVSLLENGEAVSWRNYNSNDEDGNTVGDWDQQTGVLLANMLGEKNDKLLLGKSYKEELSVANSGTINQYVRVSIYKYWTKGDTKQQELVDPSLIDLHFVNLNGAWLQDESATTAERTVLYYSRLLNSGDETPLFADTLTINGAVMSKKSNGVFIYDGLDFCVEVRVDAVQEHNAQAAALSAWGKSIVINEEAGTLSLS